MKKLILPALIVICLIAFLLAGCSQTVKEGKEEAVSAAPKTVTVTDSDGRTVSVEKPVERVITVNSKAPEILRALGVDLDDKIVGVTTYILKSPDYLPELQDKPGFDFNELNYEKIAELNPDLLISYEGGSKYTDVEKLEKLRVPVLFLECHGGDKYYESIRLLGKLFDREEKAEEFIQWMKKYEDQITDRTSCLEEKDKPQVLWLSYPDYYYPKLKVRTGISDSHPFITKAGGINIAADFEKEKTIEVDGEWIAEKNPDIIVADVLGGDYTGYSVSEADAINNMMEIRNKLINDPALKTTKAVKNGKVFIICTDLQGAGRRPAGFAYLAKFFHPELFKDLQPESILKEYYEKWQEVPNQGVYAYPQ